jgi:hypothetical protein
MIHVKENGYVIKREMNESDDAYSNMLIAIKTDFGFDFDNTVTIEGIYEYENEPISGFYVKDLNGTGFLDPFEDSSVYSISRNSKDGTMRVKCYSHKVPNTLKDINVIGIGRVIGESNYTLYYNKDSTTVHEALATTDGFTAQSFNEQGDVIANERNYGKPQI